MKRLATIIAMVLCGCAFAAVETVEFAAGGTWTCDTPGRLAAVRAFSTVASGEVTLVGTNSVPVISNETVTVTSDEVLWRRILTNQTETVTNTYPGQVVYTPPPPWLLVSQGWITNTTTRTVTRTIDTGDRILVGGSIASFSCSAGIGTNAPSNVYLAPGERITASGTAKGRILLFIER